MVIRLQVLDGVNQGSMKAGIVLPYQTGKIFVMQEQERVFLKLLEGRCCINISFIWNKEDQILLSIQFTVVHLSHH